MLNDQHTWYHYVKSMTSIGKKWQSTFTQRFQSVQQNLNFNKLFRMVVLQSHLKHIYLEVTPHLSKHA